MTPPANPWSPTFTSSMAVIGLEVGKTVKIKTTAETYLIGTAVAFSPGAVALDIGTTRNYVPMTSILELGWQR